MWIIVMLYLLLKYVKDDKMTQKEQIELLTVELVRLNILRRLYWISMKRLAFIGSKGDAKTKNRIKQGNPRKIL